MKVAGNQLMTVINPRQLLRVLQFISSTLFPTYPQRCRASLLAAPLLLCSSLSVSSSATEMVLDLGADAAALQRALVSAHSAAPRKWQIVLPAASGKRSSLLLQTYEPFAKGARVYLDEQALGPYDYDVTTIYARGAISDIPNSFAFLALKGNGDADLRYTVDGGETRTFVKAERRTTEERAVRGLGPNTVNPFLNDVADLPNQGFVMPQSANNPRVRPSAPINTTLRSETLSAGPGWSPVYTLNVPAGQALTGVLNKGPGNAGVVIIKDLDPIANWSTSSCSNGSSLYSSCLIENPDAGTYYVAAYQFDSSATTLVFDYAETLTENQQMSAIIAVDTDAGFYNDFANTDDILDYFAALFGYTSAIYEGEIDTELLIGDVFLFSASTALTLPLHHPIYGSMRCRLTGRPTEATLPEPWPPTSAPRTSVVWLGGTHSAHRASATRYPGYTESPHKPGNRLSGMQRFLPMSWGTTSAPSTLTATPEKAVIPILWMPAGILRAAAGQVPLTYPVSAP